MKDEPKILDWMALGKICETHPLFLDANHWTLPFFKHLTAWPTSEDLNSVIDKYFPHFTWNFFAPEKAPRRAKSRGQSSLSSYISAICVDRRIPVRANNLHDVLNAFSFLMFPKSKWALNHRHHLESPLGLKPGQNRTRTQDLLTIFDEGGVLRILNSEQSQFKDLVFGHAVHEHIVYNKPLRAARFDLIQSDDFFNMTLVDQYAIVDQSFEQWLLKPENCVSAQEFSSVWIEP